MAEDALNKLNELHLDVLKEIGNIGSGNAATALSAMLDRTVEMSVPNVRILEIEKAATILGGPENVVIGILSRLKGDVDGLMMFLIQQDFARIILETLLRQSDIRCGALSEMQLSAIAEIGNILISSYVSAVAALSGLFIKPSVPAVAIDMVGALLSAPAVEMADVSDKVIYIESDFLQTKQKISANTMLVSDMASLKKLLERLGLGL